MTTQRRCLGAIAGGLLIGAAGSVAWSLSTIEPPPAAGAAAARSAPPPKVSVERQGPLDPVIGQSLRGPLYDPPPPAAPVRPPVPAPTPAPPPQASLEVTLVGTIIEADQSLAIVADASGTFDVKGEGQALELLPPGITVEQIESEQVTLRYQGRRSTVQLDRRVGRNAAAEGKRGNNRRRDR